MKIAAVGDGELDSLVKPSSVRLAVVESADAFVGGLGGRLGPGGGVRLVSVVFSEPPTLEPLVEGVLGHLAGVALALWPDWYDGLITFAEVNRATFGFEGRFAEAIGRAGPLRVPLSVQWLKHARRLAADGKPPLVPGFPRAAAAAQLALAVGPKDLMVVLGVQGVKVRKGRLLGLARAAEWLARTSGARVLVAVPVHIARSSELEGIGFDPLQLRPGPERTPAAPHGGTAVGVWPVVGRPHPYSPGEQLLARRLAEDAVLGGLFQFNVRVRTRRDSQLLVDLFWPEGRVVVEVDGYEHHGNRHAFSNDRRRDYESIISDCLVLRLPHDEVVGDVEMAVDKIRDLVNFRRSKGALK